MHKIFIHSHKNTETVINKQFKKNIFDLLSTVKVLTKITHTYVIWLLNFKIHPCVSNIQYLLHSVLCKSVS